MLMYMYQIQLIIFLHSTVAKMANSRKMGPNVKIITQYKTVHPKESQHDQIFYTLKQKRQQILGARHLKNCIWRTDKQHMGHKQNAVAILLIKIAQPEVFHPFFHRNQLRTIP